MLPSLGTPTGTLAFGGGGSGWTNSLIFVEWMKHFISYARPQAQNPFLLILDNHESHLLIDAIQLAKDNHIVMLTLLPHTSHKLQPLDKTVFPVQASL